MAQSSYLLDKVYEHALALLAVLDSEYVDALTDTLAPEDDPRQHVEAILILARPSEHAKVRAPRKQPGAVPMTGFEVALDASAE